MGKKQQLALPVEMIPGRTGGGKKRLSSSSCTGKRFCFSSSPSYNSSLDYLITRALTAAGVKPFLRENVC